jgi:hypothetical protein
LAEAFVPFVRLGAFGDFLGVTESAFWGVSGPGFGRLLWPGPVGGADRRPAVAGFESSPFARNVPIESV